MAKRKQHAPEFKAKVARWRPLQREEIVAELASRCRMHPMMVHQWRRALLEWVSGMFERGGRKMSEIEKEQVNELHAKMRELAVAKSFLLKES